MGCLQATQLGPGNPDVLGVSVDSRQVKAGDLFVALRGERTDGHLFVAEAFGHGAVAAIVSRPVEAPGPLVLVQDTLKALAVLANWYRRRVDPLVVGVTGSVGKTTVKDMIWCVSSARFKTHRSEENMNTEVGLPLSLLRAAPDVQVAVMEMAMRGSGQIRELCLVAEPDYGVITSIGETHLELLGSVENIARAKWELVESLPPEGWAILNWDEDWPRRLAPSAPCQVISFGFHEEADVRATGIVDRGEQGMSYTLVTVKGQIRVDLPVNGRHMVRNSLAAAAFGVLAGLELEEIRLGLQEVSLTRMRLEMLRLGEFLVINDAYNANPASTKAALEVLKSVAKGRTVAVLGDMLELGERAVSGHTEVGEKCAQLGVDLLVAVGELSKNIASGALAGGLDASRVFWCPTKVEAVELLHKLLRNGDTVLVKGSRGTKMEEIIQGLKG
ncbi:MAG: UDP-N-acetylmuramoyl-tripeptide--D-alanyl-D-alanine ligase [Bacillota bacterium]